MIKKYFCIKYPPEGMEGDALHLESAIADGLEYSEAISRLLDDGVPPRGFQIFVEEGVKGCEDADVVLSPYKILILSERVVEQLRKIQNIRARFFEVPITKKQENTARKFFIVSFEVLCDPLSKESMMTRLRNGTEVILEPVLNARKIPNDAEMFRVRNHKGFMICTETVAKILKQLGKKGLIVGRVRVAND